MHVVLNLYDDEFIYLYEKKTKIRKKSIRILLAWIFIFCTESKSFFFSFCFQFIITRVYVKKWEKITML